MLPWNKREYLEHKGWISAICRTKFKIQLPSLIVSQKFYPTTGHENLKAFNIYITSSCSCYCNMNITMLPYLIPTLHLQICFLIITIRFGRFNYPVKWIDLKSPRYKHCNYMLTILQCWNIAHYRKVYCGGLGMQVGSGRSMTNSQIWAVCSSSATFNMTLNWYSISSPFLDQSNIELANIDCNSTRNWCDKWF